MTIDIENLILEVDEDGSGEIEFDEFKQLLGAPEDSDEDDKPDEKWVTQFFSQIYALKSVTCKINNWRKEVKFKFVISFYIDCKNI